MGVKDLMVHLDPGDRTAARLQIAVDLARRHGAHLTGLFGHRAAADTVGVVRIWPSPEYVEAAEASKALFAESTKDLAHAHWRDANRGGDAELTRVITANARYHDLSIVGQHEPGRHEHIPAELAESLVINSGRPVLVIPYIGDYELTARRPLIAWDQSRQSAHALNDALPLIAGCDEAIVVSIEKPYEEAEASVEQIGRHLGAHGINARTEVLLAEDAEAMNLLLNRISDLNADLLVIGAHRHTVLPTKEHAVDARAIMKEMVVPTLVSR